MPACMAGHPTTLRRVDATPPRSARQRGPAAAGGTFVEHDSGGTWGSLAQSTTSVAAIASLSPSDTWIGGGTSTSHWNGTAWSNVANSFTLTTAGISALAGSSTSDVWGGSNQGYIMHWNGTAWSLATSGVTTTIASISAPTPTLAMAGGTFGVIRWNGTAWAAAGLTQQTQAVWVGSTTNAWALTNVPAVFGEHVYHWNGTTWTESSPGLLGGFSAVDLGGSGTDVWVMGRAGSSCTTRNDTSRRTGGRGPLEPRPQGLSGTLVLRRPCRHATFMRQSPATRLTPPRGARQRDLGPRS
jgi:hypothetical protein